MATEAISRPLQVDTGAAEPDETKGFGALWGEYLWPYLKVLAVAGAGLFLILGRLPVALGSAYLAYLWSRLLHGF